MTYSSNEFRVPPTMKAWVLGGPDELSLLEKPVPEPPSRGAASD
jgi:L-iditol 2-dehydrogenase